MLEGAPFLLLIILVLLLPLHTGMYEQARSKLHVSAVPDSLPCREDEVRACVQAFVCAGAWCRTAYAVALRMRIISVSRGG